MALLSDIRYALRRLRQHPFYLVTAVLALTLGIGFNSTIFSLVNTLLLRPLPVQEPDRLVTLMRRESVSFSYPHYEDIRRRNTVSTDVLAMWATPMNLTGESPVRLWGYLVTGNYFPLLGVQPWRGRLLIEADDHEASAHPVAVLSHRAWVRKFGSDERIVGQTVRINNQPFTIVGITPPGFGGTERMYLAEVWVPFAMIHAIEGRDWRSDRTTRNAWTVARLKPGVTQQQADAQLEVIATQLAREYPEEDGGMTLATATPGLVGSNLRGPAVAASAGLLLAAALLLLVACANLSGLLLAQGLDRLREFAIRSAVGARRRDLVRIMLVEAGLIAIAGCVPALLLSLWLVEGLASVIPADLPFVREFSLDWRVVAFTLGSGVLSIAVAGLAPALRSSSPHNATSERFAPLRLGDVYVCLQVVLSAVLLASSAMMLRTLQSTLEMRFGFDAHSAVAVRYDLPLSTKLDRATAFADLALERVRGIPGVQAAGIANSVPFSVDHSSSSISVEGGEPIPLSRLPSATVYQATPGYFAAAGTRFVQGRDFADTDRHNAPKVAIVNQHFVDQILNGGPAIGRRFRFGNGGDWFQITGVVEGGRYQTVTENPRPAVWRALSQWPGREHTVVARVVGSEEEALRAVRSALLKLDPGLIITDSNRLSDYMDLPLAPLRITSGALTGMAVAVVFLCGLGVYALVARSVARRTREIGIRVALGAGAGHILQAVAGRLMALVGVSTAIGILGSLFVTRFLAGVFYASPDWPVYVLAALPLAGVAAVAIAVPARRAVRLQPAVAIRVD